MARRIVANPVARSSPLDQLVACDDKTMTLSDFGLPSDVVIWHAGLLTAISFLVGVLGGFVGLALGTMRLPAMLLLGMPAPVAGGTNILVSSLASLAGTIRHLRAGRVNLRIVLTMGVPAFIGAFIGGLLSDRTPDDLLIALAGALVFWQGVEFLIIARNRMRAGETSGALFGAGLEGSPGLFTPRRVASEGVIGFAVGMLGGAVGLILGSIRLPALVRILRVDPRIAAGTNLFIGFVMGAAGWVGHLLYGQVDWSLLVLMGATAMAGSYLGANLTEKVNLNLLILVMGITLLIVGVLLVGRGAAVLL